MENPLDHEASAFQTDPLEEVGMATRQEVEEESEDGHKSHHPHTCC